MMRGVVTAVLGASVICFLFSFQMLDLKGKQDFLVSEIKPSRETTKAEIHISKSFCLDKVAMLTNIFIFETF